MEIVLWFLGLIITTIVTIVPPSIVYVWRLKSENDKLRKENERLRMEKTEPVNEPRDITADKHLIRLARDYKSLTEVRVMGINSLGVVHQAREDIKELLESGKFIKFLLLNPKSEEFIQRINVECKYNREDFESCKNRLIAEWNATIMILRDIKKNIKNKDLLKVKVRNEKPTYAFTATISQSEEESFAWINEYPSEGRGTRGKQFLCRKYIPAEKTTYETYMNEFERSWRKSISIDIDNGMWIFDVMSPDTVKKARALWYSPKFCLLRNFLLYIKNVKMKWRA